jgi:hypothetical protein
MNKWIKIFGSFFVLIIFLASYASLSGTGAPQQTTTTTVPQAVYAIGFANASIISYGPTMSVSLNCNSTKLLNSTTYFVSNILNALEKNDSINNYLGNNQNSFTIYVNRFNSSVVYGYIVSRLNATAKNCTSFKGQALVTLPSNMIFAVNGQNYSIQIPYNKRNYTVGAGFSSVSNKAQVRVSALLTYNGTVYGNMSVRATGG